MYLKLTPTQKVSLTEIVHAIFYLPYTSGVCFVIYVWDCVPSNRED